MATTKAAPQPEEDKESAAKNMVLMLAQLVDDKGGKGRCPFCGLEEDSLVKMVLHLKEGHPSGVPSSSPGASVKKKKEEQQPPSSSPPAAGATVKKKKEEQQPQPPPKKKRKKMPPVKKVVQPAAQQVDPLQAGEDDLLLARLAEIHSEPWPPPQPVSQEEPPAASPAADTTTHVTDHVYCTVPTLPKETKVIMTETGGNIIIEVRTEPVPTTGDGEAKDAGGADAEDGKSKKPVTKEVVFLTVNPVPGHADNLLDESVEVTEGEGSAEGVEEEEEIDAPMDVEHRCGVCAAEVQPELMEHHAATHGESLDAECQWCQEKVTSFRHECESQDGPVVFFCHVCKKTFGSEEVLHRHLRMHKFTVWYACLYCSKKFSIANNLLRHEKSHDKDDKQTYTCTSCDITFTTPRALSVHLKSHGEPSTEPACHDCDQCDRHFRYASALEEHKRVAHRGERPHQCCQCGKQFKTRSHLLNHERAVHRGEKHYMCDVCGMGFYYLTGFRKHVERHAKPVAASQGGAAPFVKRESKKPPPKKVLPTNDLKGEDWVGAPKYVVVGEDDLMMEGKEDERVEEEQPVIAEEKKYMCDICHILMPTRSGLKHHKKRVHAKSTWRFHCKECDKAFVNGNSLRNHMWIHTGIKPYECPLCNKRYSTQGNLNLHKASHDRPQATMTCDDCGRQFQSEPYYKFHLMYHTGERPHLCDTCGAAFKTKQKLSLHQQTHYAARAADGNEEEGTKPVEERYKCGECGKGFHTVSSYRYHLKKHADTLECTLCGKTFSDPSQLTNHRKNHSQSFSCGLCARRFTSASAAKEHVESHKAGRLKYTCHVCGATFCQLRGLRPHLEVHERRGDGKEVDKVPRFVFRPDGVQVIEEEVGLEEHTAIIVQQNIEEEEVMEVVEGQVVEVSA